MELMTAADYARKFNISHRKAMRILEELMELGVYKKIIPKHNKKVKFYFIGVNEL